jgi:hypothetical protein
MMGNSRSSVHHHHPVVWAASPGPWAAHPRSHRLHRATALGAEPAFLLSFVFILLLLFQANWTLRLCPVNPPHAGRDHAGSPRTLAGLSAVLPSRSRPPVSPLPGRHYVHIFADHERHLAASLRPSLTCGQLNIGHSGFMCVGAYTSALLAGNLGVPFGLSLSGALLATAVGAPSAIRPQAARRVLRHGDGGLRGSHPPHRPALGALDPRHERFERHPQAQPPGHDVRHQRRASTCCS